MHMPPLPSNRTTYPFLFQRHSESPLSPLSLSCQGEPQPALPMNDHKCDLSGGQTWIQLNSSLSSRRVLYRNVDLGEKVMSLQWFRKEQYISQWVKFCSLPFICMPDLIMGFQSQAILLYPNCHKQVLISPNCVK